MAVVIAQISDTHLAADRPYFVENFDRVAEHLRAERPDLLIATGDLSLNGADSRDDLVMARERHAAIGVDWRAIPGNHDVGDNVDVATTQAVDAARLARWRDVLGEAYWTLDLPGWRLLALDALTMGSGLPEEAAQFAFVRAAVAGLGGRALMLLIHKPLFVHAPDEPSAGGMYLTPAPRHALLAALGGATPRLVASGHVHQWRAFSHDGTRHVWAPGTSFVTPPGLIPAHGTRTIGYVEHVLEADGGFSSRLVGVSRTVLHDLADFPGAYGPITAHR